MLVSQSEDEFFNALFMQILYNIKDKRLSIYSCHTFWKIRNYRTQSCSQTSGKNDSFYDFHFALSIRLIMIRKQFLFYQFANNVANHDMTFLYSWRFV